MPGELTVLTLLLKILLPAVVLLTTYITANMLVANRKPASVCRESFKLVQQRLQDLLPCCGVA